MNRKPPNGEGVQPTVEIRPDENATPPDVRIKKLIPNINLQGLRSEEGVLVGDTKTIGTTSTADGIMVLYQNFHSLEHIADTFNLDDDIDVEKKREIRKLLQRLSDGVVVDLGAGVKSTGYYFAHQHRAAGYIGVEPAHPADLQKEVQTQADRIKSRPATPFVVVAENMLAFLKRLPDDSATIITSNIDSNVIPDPKIREQIGLEINRVIGARNMYITNFSEVPLPRGMSYRVYNYGDSTVPTWDDTSAGVPGQLPKRCVVIKK